MKDQNINQATNVSQLSNLPIPPIAPKKAFTPPPPYVEGNDPYFWLRLTDEQKNADTPDTHTQEVLEYIEAENQYTQAMLAHTESLQEKLYEEIIGRMQPDESTPPYFSQGYYYYARYEEGTEYPIYCRKLSHLQAPEEILLNVNELAKALAFYQIKGIFSSPNQCILGYAEDNISRRIYTLRFKNLETGELLPDQIPNTAGNMVWANDSQTLYYTVLDHTLRPFKIYKHILGTDAKHDEEIYHESDETFLTYLYKSKSKDYIIIGSYSTVSQEYRTISANTPKAQPILFQPRQRHLEYSIDHINQQWYIRHNKEAKNFQLSISDEINTGQEHWQTLVPHRSDTYLEDFVLFNQHVVLCERKAGLPQIQILNHQQQSHYIHFDEEVFMVHPYQNHEANTPLLRLQYQSMTTPPQTIDYHMDTKGRTLIKEKKILGGFAQSNYVTKRIWVTARDQTQVPVSIVAHRSTPLDGSAPCLLYGYGSYGHIMDPYFSSVRLSLLDRGFIYAIAHIRGGEELGRPWYEDGKLLKKKNTFYDFIDCGQWLIEHKIAAPDQLFAMGGSAGGLLMGVVINEAPQLWRGVLAAVPFVDVLNTMLDETIPLTTGEFDEWGNPKIPEFYEYMRSYSPYENIKSQDYPALLITTGYHDSQVQYWEPAKWTAKLRVYKTDQNPLLLHTNFDTGHGGESGRYKQHKETAMMYAFILDLADRKNYKLDI